MKREELNSLIERVRKLRQDPEEPCPNCFDAEFPGHKRGMRCETCHGSGRVENPNFDPSLKDEVIAFLQSVANAQPVAVRHSHDGDGWLYLDNGSGSDWLTRHWDAERLFTSPLDDAVEAPEKDAPYLYVSIREVVAKHNPRYGADRVCECGHPYYRHFDSYEDMEPVGCKYCDCFTFRERVERT